MESQTNGLILKFTLIEIDDFYHAAIYDQFQNRERLKELEKSPKKHSVKIFDLHKSISESCEWCKKLDEKRNLKTL